MSSKNLDLQTTRMVKTSSISIFGNSITTYVEKPSPCPPGSSLARPPIPNWMVSTQNAKPWVGPPFSSKCQDPHTKIHPVIRSTWGRFFFHFQVTATGNLITIYIQTHGDNTRVDRDGKWVLVSVERSWCESQGLADWHPYTRLTHD